MVGKKYSGSQAKFSYDLSPVEVVVSKGERRWRAPHRTAGRGAPGGTTCLTLLV